MPTADEIEQFLTKRLKGALSRAGITELTPETSLTETGLVDSFGLLELIMAVQEKFGVTVDVGEIDPEVLTTFGGFVSTIHSAAQAS
jgi:acyl carrier protein